jgi:hypothetical protein
MTLQIDKEILKEQILNLTGQQQFLVEIQRVLAERLNN